MNAPSPFLTELFEFELCHECNGDAEHHDHVAGPFGLPFAACKFERTDDGAPHPTVQAFLDHLTL